MRLHRRFMNYLDRFVPSVVINGRSVDELFRARMLIATALLSGLVLLLLAPPLWSQGQEHIFLWCIGLFSVGFSITALRSTGSAKVGSAALIFFFCCLFLAFGAEEKLSFSGTFLWYSVPSIMGVLLVGPTFGLIVCSAMVATAVYLNLSFAETAKIFIGTETITADSLLFLYDLVGVIVVTYALVALFEVSRKRYVRDLEVATARYRAVIDAQNEMICRYTPDGIITYVNDAYCDYFKKSDGELIGKSFIPLIPQEDKKQLHDQLEKLVKGETDQIECTHRVIESNGSTRWHRWRDVAIRNKNGELVEIQAVGKDITNEKALEEELQTQRAKAIQTAKMASLGEMAGGIAHEVNNPITIIKEIAAKVERDIRGNELNKERGIIDMEKIQNTVDRIHKIVQGLKRLSRSEDVASFEKVLLQEIVADSLAMCQERFRHNGVALVVSPIPHDLELECSPIEVSQVLLNLLSNAFDAVKGLEEPKVELKLREYRDFVEFDIIDNGPGIDKEIQEKIFEPFFTTKDRKQGTGLGLSICRSLVERHDGEIKLAQKPGATVLRVILPRLQSTAESEDTAA